MRTLILSTFVMAFGRCSLAAPVDGAQEMRESAATLTGAAEVPGPGDPKGSGTVQRTLDPDTGEVCYELHVANMQEATAAHNP